MLGRHRTIGWSGVLGSVGLAACVQVPEPSIDAASASTSTATSVVDDSATTATTATAAMTSTTSTTATADTTGDGGALPGTPFVLHWAVHSEPVDVPDTLAESVDVRDNVHIFTDLGLGQTPASVGDPEAFVASIVEQVEMTVPDDGAPGLGLLVNTYWEVPWCQASTVDRDAFAASSLGAGLEEAELGPAWEQAALSLLVDLIEQCRAARPNLQWTIASQPRQEYWQLVGDDEPEDVQAWRDCAVLDPSAMELWAAVDLLAPEVPFFYPTHGNEATGERNTQYIDRFTEGARLSGKPVVPIVEGRYRRSSDEDTNPIMWLPLLEEDFGITAQTMRLAGAQGVVYWFDSDRCWNYDEGCDAPDPGKPTELFLQYVEDVVRPAFEALQ